MNTTKMKTENTSPERLIIGSALLANGGSYLYNLVLAKLLGPESFTDRVITITLLVSLLFIGMVLQIVWKNMDYRKLPILSFIPIKIPTSCKIGLIFIFLITVVLLTSNLVDYFPTGELGMALAIGFAMPLCTIKRLLPAQIQRTLFSSQSRRKQVANSFSLLIVIVAGYELLQILLCNADIIVVRYFFSPFEAQAYTSLTMMGKGFYGISWVLTLIFFLKILRRYELGEELPSLFKKHIRNISLGLAGLVVLSALFSRELITFFFEEHSLLTKFLWQYLLAVSLFSISNLYVYFFMVQKNFVPAVFSITAVLIQTIFIAIFSSSIELVIQLQIVSMTALLVAQTIYFFSKYIR